jgi:hypothetical protein
MTNNFLKTVLGEDGAEALHKANQRVPTLGTVLVPRTIVSWLSTAVRIRYEGEIPGIDNSYIALEKSEEGFTGAMTIGDVVHSFSNSDLLYVAASIGVALGIDDQPLHPMLKSTDLSKIGTSIDLLVKAKVVAQAIAEESSEESEEEIDKTETPGPAAAARGPKEPEAPKAPQVVAPSTNKMKPPVQKKELVVKKSEAQHDCRECGLQQFRADRFAGCMCVRALAKSVKTQVIGDTYRLQVQGLSAEDLQTLMLTLRG